MDARRRVPHGVLLGALLQDPGHHPGGRRELPVLRPERRGNHRLGEDTRLRRM